MRGFPGDVTVTFEGSAKIECWDNSGSPVVLHLYDTLYVSKSATDLLSLQRLCKARYTIVHAKWTTTHNCSMIKNSVGDIVGRISEDEKR